MHMGIDAIEGHSSWRCFVMGACLGARPGRDLQGLARTCKDKRPFASAVGASAFSAAFPTKPKQVGKSERVAVCAVRFKPNQTEGAAANQWA